MEISVDEPVSKYIQKPILVSQDETVKNAAKMMSEKKLGAVIVSSGNDALGIVTEWDILSRVVAQGKDPNKTVVREVMSSPVISVSPSLTTGEAIKLMAKNRIRRLVVKDGKILLGVVTLSQVVGSSRESTITLPLLEPTTGARCPYCGSILKDREELSRHVDRVHIGEEMLRGAHGPSP